MPAESSARPQGAAPASPSSLMSLKWLAPGMPSQVSTSNSPSRPSGLPSPKMLRMSLLVTVGAASSGVALLHPAGLLDQVAARIGVERARRAGIDAIGIAGIGARRIGDALDLAAAGR